jgi:hypothetical protein
MAEAIEKQRPTSGPKLAIDHVNSLPEDEKCQADDGVRDYTGSARKTDPEEIRLVRKLDLWIMVCYPLHHFIFN